MMPESGVSKLMRAGVSVGLLFMFAGVILSAFGVYSEDVSFTIKNLLTDGAGLMYMGTFFMIGTPLAVLVYLAAFYLFKKPVKYAVYCIAMIIFLLIVVLTRI